MVLFSVGVQHPQEHYRIGAVKETRGRFHSHEGQLGGGQTAGKHSRKHVKHPMVETLENSQVRSKLLIKQSTIIPSTASDQIFKPCTMISTPKQETFDACLLTQQCILGTENAPFCKLVSKRTLWKWHHHCFSVNTQYRNLQYMLILNASAKIQTQQWHNKYMVSDLGEFTPTKGNFPLQGLVLLIFGGTWYLFLDHLRWGSKRAVPVLKCDEHIITNWSENSNYQHHWI